MISVSLNKFENLGSFYDQIAAMKQFLESFSNKMYGLTTCPRILQVHNLHNCMYIFSQKTLLLVLFLTTAGICIFLSFVLFSMLSIYRYVVYKLYIYFFCMRRLFRLCGFSLLIHICTSIKDNTLFQYFSFIDLQLSLFFMPQLMKHCYYSFLNGHPF